MGIKRITTSVALLLLMFSAAQAQEIKTDSVGNNTESRNGQADSLQILSAELAQIKSQLSSEEKERQYEKIWRRRKYWKIGLANPSIERIDGEPMTWKTDFSVFIQSGKTTYFHRKPIGGVLKFGFDFGMSLNYAKLKLDNAALSGSSSSTPGTIPGSNPGGFDDIVIDDPNGSALALMGVNLGMHKIEYDVHIGPNISVNPWNHLIVSAYFHARPTAAGIVENDKFSYGFGCAMSAGVSVSYKLISVGVEGLWSTIKYKQPSFDEDDDDGSEENGGIFNTKEFKLKQKGPRFYIALRF